MKVKRSVWDLYSLDYWYKFWTRVHVRAHHMDVQRMYERMRKKEFDEMMKKNLIHERYPQFGNATNEDDLIVEVVHAEAHFGKKVKVISHPKYYKDCFENNPNPKESSYYRSVAGINIELSTLVDTYILEFEEKE
ncbi:hypothetical protein PQE68_gp136 [Bacillus phage vB_BanS_Sophrita]|uniref:Uncharacterized protein n=1 Tax=Bacillus phage vB_BanS_Sophrita TaxID=2894790 RepID=A0AAE8YXP8_9CAUD|nr:hypothetical protein PQE68_gp136 [Bacillus phage vB_BanS_Sophrita]UGO50727.1 hypothetical protein SOPHRITA_136 [Bacillus phage vB_BanS_Sophrita]